MKPPIFYDTESEDSYEFIINYKERLHKMWEVERYGVDFVIFQLMGNAKL